MSFIDDLRAKRQKLADVLVDEEYSGIRAFVEDLYPDRAHFIYELLMNAEDAEATSAQFALRPDSLTFEHDGCPFSDQDVRDITNIGKSAKRDKEDKIGRFGIGFKAVFAYCETPHIWSPTHSFKITDLVLPWELGTDAKLNGSTRFDFPFNNPKKRREAAHVEVKAGLKDLAETTLLFLTHLESICWKIGDAIAGEVQRIQHSENHFEVIQRIGGKVKDSSHFLRFDWPVKGLERQHVSVAFRLDLRPKLQRFDPARPISKQLKIVPADPGSVAVSFPAKKERSGLRFHLHAPFVPELSRASIKDTPANLPLFRQLAALAANSLHKVRDLELLTADFLAVLPNSQDSLSERYECVKKAIIDAFKAQPLTPTYGGTHAPAKHLLQAKASLKTLLSVDGIKLLVEDKKRRQWAVGATQKSTFVDRFLEDLAIEKWDIDEFVKVLRKRAYYSLDDEFAAWLSKKPFEWHQELYALLYKELQPTENLVQLRCAAIIRISDGSYTHGGESYFSTDGVEHDEVHPRVDARVYTSGNNKSQQANAKKCLELLGVRVVGEAEEVKAILENRYKLEAKIPDDSTVRKDLKRFVALVEKERDTASLFSGYSIFLCEDSWRPPEEVYIDRPFTDSALRAYFDAIGKVADRYPLAEGYRDYGIATKRILKFAEAVGVKVRLEVEWHSAFNHPMKDELTADFAVGGGSTYQENDDWTIPHISKAFRKPSLALSRAVWEALLRLEPRQLEARYRAAKKYKTKHEPSSLVLALKDLKWIPQGKKLFVRPADASRVRLPNGFLFDSGFPWLKAIGFGENVVSKTEEYRQWQSMAKRKGFRDKRGLEQLDVFGSYPPEMRERGIAFLERLKVVEDPGVEEVDGSTRNKNQPHLKHGRETSRAGATNDRPEISESANRKRPQVTKDRRRFITYVAVHPDEKERDLDGLDDKTRRNLEEQAIRFILEKYPELKRTPANNPGFDLFEESTDGKPIRWVEVKAMTGCLHDRPVGMSHVQFNSARENGDSYWLYIVEYASDKKNRRLRRIRNPAGKARTYTFDEGWIDIAISDESQESLVS